MKIYVVIGQIPYEFCDAIKAFTNKAEADKCMEEIEELSDQEQTKLFDQEYDYFIVQEVELD